VAAGGRAVTVAVRWTSDADEIAALEDRWRDLAAGSREATPLGGPDYLLPWYRQYAGRAGRPLLGTAWQEGTLVALAPLVVRRARVGGVPVTCVQFAAAGAEAGEFLLADGRPELTGTLLESLAAQVPFDVARFNLLDPAAAEFAALARAAAQAGLALETLPTAYATVDLREGYDAYHARLSGKFRANLRRRARAAQAEGALRVEGVHLEPDVPAVERAVGRMLAVSDASWKARRGGPMAEHHRGFYREIARRFGARGRLDLAILKLGGADRAYMMGVVDRDVYYDVTLSFDDAVRALAPGVLLTQEVLRRLAARGIRTVVSHGVHEYKRHFATAIVPRRRAFVFARRPRAALSRALRFSLGPVWTRLGLLP
jgi:CelD/BcsL family acetyltransferase involved in cellulose biosynthesis